MLFVSRQELGQVHETIYVGFIASKVDNVEQLQSTVTTCNHL